MVNKITAPSRQLTAVVQAQHSQDQDAYLIFKNNCSMKALKQSFSFTVNIKCFFMFSNFINKIGSNMGNAGNLK